MNHLNSQIADKKLKRLDAFDNMILARAYWLSDISTFMFSFFCSTLFVSFFAATVQRKLAVNGQIS